MGKHTVKSQEHTSSSERIVKSKERKSKFGEVYTPSWLVSDMCDMLEKEHPDAFSHEKTFLEPSCGNGNFLVEIAKRKLKNGATYQQAAETIFGVDLLPDNIEESISRLEEMLPGTRKTLEKNIVCGNFLTKKTITGENIWFLTEEEEQLCLWGEL